MIEQLTEILLLFLLGEGLWQLLKVAVGWGKKMGINNATVIVVLKEHDSGNENYFVKQIHNPDNVLSTSKYFHEFIYYSDVFVNRHRAVEHAKELEYTEYTSRGILIYDALSSHTLAEAMMKIDKKTGYVSYIH